MKLYKLIISILLISVFVSCNEDYSKYSQVPKYVNNMPPADKKYFDAYNDALELWDVAYQELYIPTQYGTAHVVASGIGNSESLVLLHGMNASSTMWYPNIKALSEDFQVFAIDFLLEPGKSYKEAEINEIEQISAWYFEVIKKLKLKEYSIIGASKGGWMAVNLALYNQDKIKKMVLLSPAQTFIWIRPSANLFENIVSLFSSDDKQFETSLKTMSINPANIEKKYLDQYYLATKRDSLNEFTLDMTPFSKNDLKSLKMPVLVLIGDDDMINNDKSIRLTKELIGSGQAEVISNAGHFLSIDQADAVNAKMIEFLKN
ncbi:alpha/beta fold hydrolase [Hanstruepera marina]|uniref:alpha/beta fold hydrolase n=1 Tax=Hanstruepera marina TaxID=2873265 RepID=UPI001CA631E0|nr:alpha/beta hydrolase [Hanstruepera marina]